MSNKYRLKLTDSDNKMKIYKLFKQSGGNETDSITNITQTTTIPKDEQPIEVQKEEIKPLEERKEIIKEKISIEDIKPTIEFPTETINVDDTIKNLNTLVEEEKLVTQKEISQLESVKVPSQNPSEYKFYTIPAGKILYHGSIDKKTFDPFKIKLSDSTLSAFFSPYKGFASDYIMRCSAYPAQNGYIHAFRVKKDIDKILILSPYELKNRDNVLAEIDNKFCKREPNKEDMNGIGFFFPEKDLDNFAGDIEKHLPTGAQLDPNNGEFALCNPREYLEYINTQECVSLRKLSEMYNFSS